MKTCIHILWFFSNCKNLCFCFSHTTEGKRFFYSHRCILYIYIYIFNIFFANKSTVALLLSGNRKILSVSQLKSIRTKEECFQFSSRWMNHSIISNLWPFGVLMKHSIPRTVAQMVLLCSCSCGVQCRASCSAFCDLVAMQHKCWCSEGSSDSNHASHTLIWQKDQFRVDPRVCEVVGKVCSVTFFLFTYWGHSGFHHFRFHLILLARTQL